MHTKPSSLVPIFCSTFFAFTRFDRKDCFISPWLWDMSECPKKSCWSLSETSNHEGSKWWNKSISFEWRERNLSSPNDEHLNGTGGLVSSNSPKKKRDLVSGLSALFQKKAHSVFSMKNMQENMQASTISLLNY